MKIALDLDGVLADTHASYINHLNQRNSSNYSLDQLDHYYMKDTPFSLEHFLEIARQKWNRKTIGLVDRKAPSHLKSLSKAHEIEIVTARTDVEKKILREWLEDKQIPFNQIKFEKQKKTIEHDVLIDDCPEYIGGNAKILLFDRPYNQDVKIENGKRVHDFQEIRKAFQDM